MVTVVDCIKETREVYKKKIEEIYEKPKVSYYATVKGFSEFCFFVTYLLLPTGQSKPCQKSYSKLANDIKSLGSTHDNKKFNSARA